jgi:hypothetical protein
VHLHCSKANQSQSSYHLFLNLILTHLKSSTNDDLIRSLITTLNLIDITTDDWSIIKNLRRKSKKVNKVCLNYMFILL